MKNTIQHLRERSNEEKRVIAAWIAIGVVVVLFAGWVIFFFHSISTQPTPTFNAEAASVYDTSGLQLAQQQLLQAYGSTTQFIQTAQGAMEMQEIGTTSTTTQPEQ